MSSRAASIIAQNWFQPVIVATILLAGVLAGLETHPAIVEGFGPLLRALDMMVLGVFVAEAALKLAAQGRTYFRDGWNLFDFSIVALCLLPLGSQFAVVLRLLRVLRVLRLVTALPKLQLLVGALLRSLSSMGYVGMLLGLMFYIYAVAGIHLFSAHDPARFGALHTALLTLFQIITLDNWSDVFNPLAAVAPLTATLFFVSFILLGTMIMLNLFIGVITNSMSEMHIELESGVNAGHGGLPADQALREITDLERQIVALRGRLEDARRAAP